MAQKLQEGNMLDHLVVLPTSVTFDSYNLVFLLLLGHDIRVHHTIKQVIYRVHWTTGGGETKKFTWNRKFNVTMTLNNSSKPSDSEFSRLLHSGVN